MFIDYIIIKLNSFSFRIFIVFLSSIIIFTSNNNYFQNHIYLISFTIYLVVLFYLISKDQKHFPYIRLVLDYFVVGLVLYNKNLTEFNNIILLLLPIFNSPNSTKKYRRIIYPFILTIIIFFINDQFKFIYLFGLIVLIGLIYLFYKRITFYNAFGSLYEKIDEHYNNKINFGNLHKLFRAIMEKYNSNTWIKLISHSKVLDIYCFEIKRNHISIRSSTTFLWRYNLDMVLQRINELEEPEILHNIEMTLDDKKSHYNSILIFSFNSTRYFVVISWKNYSSLLFRLTICQRVFKPYFAKIIKLLILEQSIKNEKRIHLNNIKASQTYINNAKLALHFLRNKFSPIDNYFAMIEELKNANPEKKIIIEELANKELERAKRSLQSISQRTGAILEKAQDPFYPNNIQLIKTRLLYILLRESWEEVFGDIPITVNLFADDTKEIIRVDQNCIQIVFHDLITNIEKFNQGIKNVSFNYDVDYVTITFNNDFRKDQTVTEDLVQIVKDLSTKVRYEIVTRKAYGLMSITSLLNQMDIKYEFNVDVLNYMFSVKLSFKRLTNESSDFRKRI